MSSLMSFGDIFYIDEYSEDCGENHKTEYVFLYETIDLMYLAKILNKSISMMCKNSFIKLNSNPNTKHRTKDKAFLYVELTTKEYKERVAHLANSDYDPKNYVNPIRRLNDGDIQDIKNKILENYMFFDRVLVDYVKKINNIKPSF